MIFEAGFFMIVKAESIFPKSVSAYSFEEFHYFCKKLIDDQPKR